MNVCVRYPLDCRRCWDFLYLNWMFANIETLFLRASLHSLLSIQKINQQSKSESCELKSTGELMERRYLFDVKLSILFQNSCFQVKSSIINFKGEILACENDFYGFYLLVIKHIFEWCLMLPNHVKVTKISIIKYSLGDVSPKFQYQR